MPLVPPCTFIPEADPAFQNQSVACQSDTNPGSGCTADIFSLCPLTVDNPEDVYCCPFGDGVFADNNGGTITLHGAGCALPGHSFTFPIMNDEMEPMYKTAFGGTTQAPWVRIAFEEYCGDGNTPPPSNQYTNKTIITVGNASQPCNDDVCTASIKAFQYGWGTINQGNRCKVTIMDEKGSSFETWVQRLITNPEGAGKPILGVYRMKVQMGWYVTGGAASDECGQGSAQPGVPAGDGENSSYTICSPTMWFLPDMINMHYEGGKFIYELEGVDLVYRAQESRTAKVQGAEFEDNMYFTEAVTLMAQQAFPPFRVRFLALNQKGQITSLKFYQRPDVVQDDPCLGPYGVWNPKELTPMGAIQLWMNQGALAVDQTGQLNTDGTPKTLGITMNYDSTQDLAGAGMFPIVQPDWYTFNCEGCIQGRTHTAGCQDNLPTVGTLILWAGNGVPNCQSSYDDDTINNRMKAVYVVNGGNCSPVIAFNPVLKWHFNMGMKAGGMMVPTNGAATKQTIGSDDASCVATGGRGLAAILGTVPTFMMNLLGFGNNNATTQTQKSIKLHSAANVLFNGIEAELRVQGDPSYWLCSPVSGYGRCVGIVFINPYYLTDIGGDCPAFTLNNGTVCNTILTNKGWWIRGADHQINDGTYITTIKVALPVPGTELEYTGTSVTTGAAALGAWIYGAILAFGGTFANSKSYPLGSLATNAINMGGCPAVFVGGGANCPNGQACTEGMTNCNGTTDPNDDDTCDGFAGIDVPDEDDEP